MTFTIEYEQEDGRWLAEVKEMPGISAHGADPEEAVEHAQVLALREMTNRLEQEQEV